MFETRLKYIVAPVYGCIPRARSSDALFGPGTCFWNAGQFEQVIDSLVDGAALPCEIDWLPWCAATRWAVPFVPWNVVCTRGSRNAVVNVKVGLPVGIQLGDLGDGVLDCAVDGYVGPIGKGLYLP